jgi:tetratricopeptide (TPR) repeat protein
VLAATLALAGCAPKSKPPARDVLAAHPGTARSAPLRILYPLDGTIFPPELPAPTFRWADPAASAWVVGFTFDDGADPLAFDAFAAEWTPPDDAWEAIKRRSLGRTAAVRVLGLDRSWRIASAGTVTFGTSPDEVGAPLFYREVNLPFIEAVRDPSRIRWRFGPVSSKAPPPVVLENLPVCGNCHSFSADGRVLGMDIDYANDKGSYAIKGVEPRMVLDRGSIITWSDYRREDGQPTFGLLSQVSPDGRTVVSTVKDRSVFVPRPGTEFSQLFYPIQGILALYDRESRAFRSLPGADDPRYVQSNPVWSPDGKTIVFIRARAHVLRSARGGVLLTEEECRESLAQTRDFRYDLYRLPFNGGAGGEAVPLAGASGDGTSNYFPKFSPDGNWIVFCKSARHSLLQPDSALYIVPAGGGEARRMRCNTPRMNSWHTWSPNGRWLVFSSKARGPYTRLFITHVDAEGNDTPAVELDRLTAPDRAANIPEFVNAAPGAIASIAERFVDDVSFVRAAKEFLLGGDAGRAIDAYRRALAINPGNPDATLNLGVALESLGRSAEAAEHYRQALRADPDSAALHYNLALASEGRGGTAEAITHYLETIRLDPRHPEARLNLAAVYGRLGDAEQSIHHYREAVRVRPDDARAHHNLGSALQDRGLLDEAEPCLARAMELDPKLALARNNMGNLLMARGRTEEAVARYKEALEIDPDCARACSNLGVAMQKLGRYDEAERHYREALRIDPQLEQARLNLLALRRGRSP